MTRTINVLATGDTNPNSDGVVAYITDIAGIQGLVPDLSLISADYPLRDDMGDDTGTFRDNRPLGLSAGRTGTRFGEVPDDALLFPPSYRLTSDVGTYGEVPINTSGSWTIVYSQMLEVSDAVQWHFSTYDTPNETGWGVRTAAGNHPRFFGYVEDGSGGGTLITELFSTGVPLSVNQWGIRAISYDDPSQTITFTDCLTGGTWSSVLPAPLHTSSTEMRIGRPNAENSNVTCRFGRILASESAVTGPALTALAQLLARDLWTRSREAVRRNLAGAEQITLTIAQL